MPNYVLLHAVLRRGHFLYEALENVCRLADWMWWEMPIIVNESIVNQLGTILHCMSNWWNPGYSWPLVLYLVVKQIVLLDISMLDLTWCWDLDPHLYPTCYHPHYSHLAISWLPNSITAIWSKVANAVPVNIYFTRSYPHSGVYNINFMILNLSWKFPRKKRKISQICSRKKENSKKSQVFAQKKFFSKKIIVLNTSYEATIL